MLAMPIRRHHRRRQDLELRRRLLRAAVRSSPIRGIRGGRASARNRRRQYDGLLRRIWAARRASPSAASAFPTAWRLLLRLRIPVRLGLWRMLPSIRRAAHIWTV